MRIGGPLQKLKAIFIQPKINSIKIRDKTNTQWQQQNRAMLGRNKEAIIDPRWLWMEFSKIWQIWVKARTDSDASAADMIRTRMKSEWTKVKAMDYNKSQKPPVKLKELLIYSSVEPDLNQLQNERKREGRGRKFSGMFNNIRLYVVRM